MNKEENKNMKFEASIPLLTKEEINGIDINMNGIINKFTKMFVKEKDLAIAQHIIKRQQEKIEELEQKESILDKVTDKLKEDIKNDYCIKEYTSNEYGITGAKEYSVKPYAREILNIMEGEKK